MDFEGAKQYIINRFIDGLSSKLYYHGLHHTLDVFNAAEKLAELEGITGHELVLLKTAALFHDAGFLEQYTNNETLAVETVRNILPQFGYSSEDIELIANMIIATDITKMPHTHLEKILCDADLDYLGREDFHVFAGLLKRELNANGLPCDDVQWDNIQIKFLENHNYHTVSARLLRETIKKKHIKEIRKRLPS